MRSYALARTAENIPPFLSEGDPDPDLASPSTFRTAFGEKSLATEITENTEA
ncbi:MAG: hypothetical protein ACOX52_08950 [Verrucomicrobiota bacterium]